MDPVGDLLRAMLAIDWPGALVAGAVAVAVAALVFGTGVRIGERAVSRAPDAPPRAAIWFARLGRAVRGTAEPDRSRWLCGTCHSWNPPGSTGCASGCGTRAACEQPVTLDPDGPGGQRGGRATRRG